METIPTFHVVCYIELWQFQLTPLLPPTEPLSPVFPTPPAWVSTAPQEAQESTAHPEAIPLSQVRNTQAFQGIAFHSLFTGDPRQLILRDPTGLNKIWEQEKLPNIIHYLLNIIHLWRTPPSPHKSRHQSGHSATQQNVPAKIILECHTYTQKRLSSPCW